MKDALLTCLSHTPLKGYVDPLPAVVDEVGQVVAQLRAEIEAFDPELVFLFAPDHYNGFFLDAMPQLCIGTAAESVGDYSTSAGPLAVPREIAEACAAHVVARDIGLPVSYRMQVVHGFAQALDVEREAQGAAGRTADFKEGALAFLARRPAQFTGR